MLSLFPSLLVFGVFAPFLLRLILGITVVYFGMNYIKQKQHTPVILGMIEIVLGLLLIGGIYTQGAALLVALILGLKLGKKIATRAFLTHGVNYYLILFVISLSLALSGPGAFAFDRPF